MARLVGRYPEVRVYASFRVEGIAGLMPSSGRYQSVPTCRPALALLPSTRNQLGLDAFYLLPWNNWFYGGLGNFLQSSEQGINRQGTAGGGIGRYLKDTNLARISVLAGFAGQNTEYQQSITSQKLASGLIAANFQFSQFNKTNATVATVFLPVISQPGPVKFNLSATYYIKITGSPAICLGCLALRQLG